MKPMPPSPFVFAQACRLSRLQACRRTRGPLHIAAIRRLRAISAAAHPLRAVVCVAYCAWSMVACGESADAAEPAQTGAMAGGSAVNDMRPGVAGAASGSSGDSDDRDGGVRSNMNPSNNARTGPTGRAGAGGVFGAPDAATPAGAAGAAGKPDLSDDARNEPESEQWKPGDYPADPMSENYLDIANVTGQKGYTRQYKVHIPATYDPSVPTPTVFCIHGLSQTAVNFCVVGSSLLAKSDKEGFILVMPLGYGASWNAGTCCGAASTEQLDDVALMRAIFAEVSKHVNIDRRRVYATGFSNGGFMSWRLACDAADIFAAVAPSAGGIGTNELSAATWDLVGPGSAIGATNASSDFTQCTPSQPISVLDLHGTEDGLVAFGFQSASLGLIAQRNGCTSTTRPADDPMSRGDTMCATFMDCPPGIEVTGCSVQGGGHNWFGSPDCGTAAGELGCSIVGYNSTVLVNTEAVWNFFKLHSR